MKQPKKKTKVVSQNCSVVFSIGSDVYTGVGETVLEALKTIKPKNYLGEVRVSATISGKTASVPFRAVPLQLRRVFEKPIEMELFAKRLQVLL